MSCLPLLCTAMLPPPSSQCMLTLTHVGAVLMEKQAKESNVNSRREIQVLRPDRTQDFLSTQALSAVCRALISPCPQLLPFRSESPEPPPAPHWLFCARLCPLESLQIYSSQLQTFHPYHSSPSQPLNTLLHVPLGASLNCKWWGWGKEERLTSVWREAQPEGVSSLRPLRHQLPGT